MLVLYLGNYGTFKGMNMKKKYVSQLIFFGYEVI